MKDAFARYIEDCEARRLGSETLRKYRLLEREMVEEFGNLPVDSIGMNELAEYLKRWQVSVGTDRKKIERLRAFFRFCIGRELIEKNPAIHLVAGKEKPKQSVPFTDEEIAAIMRGVEQFEIQRRKQLRAFVLLLRYSRLRIQDAVRITMTKFPTRN